MLELEVQIDRVELAAETLPQEDCKEHLEVMVLHAEIPQGRTCAEQRVGGGEICTEDLNRDCRNKSCVTCAARNPNSGYNQEEFGIQGSAML
eukprot:8507880-Heterocapsa_arctica.AAC.1